MDSISNGIKTIENISHMNTVKCIFAQNNDKCYKQVLVTVIMIKKVLFVSFV